MNRDFVRKAKEMLRDNRRRHRWQALAAVAGAVVAVVCAVSLMYPAHALTGGDSLRSAITDDSALYYKAADSGDDAWQKVDASTPIAADSSLRLRIAFKLPAGTLANGAVLQYQLPDGVKLDASRGTVTGDLLAGATVADPTNQDATTIGSYEVKDGILTVTFNDDVAAENAGTTADASTSADASDSSSSAADATDATQAQEGKELSAYVDLDLGFDELTTDSDGLATIQLNDSVKLQVTKAVEKSEETAAASDSASDSSLSSSSDSASSSSSSSDSSTSTQGTASAKTLSVRSMAKSSGNTVSTNGTSSTNSTNSTNDTVSTNSTNATSAIDFGQYLTKDTTVQKLVNGKWTTATSFNDGDEVRVNLNYSLPAGTVDSTNRTITYTLPNGIKPVQSASGRATDSDGKEIGDYSINTDGTVTVTFDESFASQKGAILGNVTFQGKVSASDAGDSGKIHIGGNAEDITIVKPVEDGHDIKTEKTGKLDFGNGKISNTITVSTTKGTGDTVKLEDSITNGNCTNAKPAYDQSSLKIVKVDASGNQTTVTGYTPKWTSDSNGIGFSVEGLPALAANEKYVATYDVNINVTDANKAGKVGNSAHATSGNHSSWGWSSKDWQDEFVKTGEFDKETGLISWRIKVNPNGKDITKGSAWTVHDVLPSGCKLYGSYTVHGQNAGVLTTGGTWDDTTIDYTFPTTGLTDAQKTDTYYIDFYTTAPTSNGNVTNSANINENNNSTSSSTTIGVKHRDYDLTKSFTSESADSTTGKIHTNRWSVDATLPDTQLSTFEYTDTIEDAVDGDGMDMGANSHYAYASKLDSAFSKYLYMVVDDYTQYQYKGASNPTYCYRSDNASLCGNTTDVTIKVTYYDANGNVVPATNSTTPVKSFKIKVNIADGHKIFGKHLKIDKYSTYSDTSSAVEGSTWTVKNTGTIAGKSSTASHDIEIPKTFDKQVYTGKGGNGADKYKSGDTTVDYDAMGGVLSYRLMLNTTKADEGTITITDTLPKGETVVDGSVTARFFKNEFDLHDSNYKGTQFVDGTNPTYTTTANADGTTTLTITITSYVYADDYAKVAVYYKADISKDADWNDPAATKKTYSNTADWNGHKSSQNTTVTRESQSVSKTGVQLDKNGDPVVIENGQPKVEPSNKVRYYVDINPTGKDLNPKSKTLTLTDTMQNLSTYDPQLDMSSIKLYAYDITAGHHIGKEISSDRYSMKYDQKTGTITVTVPDELACVLVYDYTIDRDAVTSGAEVKNNCSLDGSWSSSSDMKLVEITASASAYHKIITMYKVDADNYQKPVKATFKLEYWDKSSSTWKTKSNALETTDGKLTWDVGGATPELTSDTLYRLTEKKTQEGYSLDSTPHYFIWMSAQNNSDTSYNNSGASSAKKPDGSTNISKDQISIFKNTGGSMYVTNKYTSLAVKKDWAHEDGSKASAPSGSSVTMQLERYTMYDDPDQTCAVSIHEEGTPASGSTWYDQKDLTTFNIQRGSSLTIKFNDWQLDVDVYVNGEKYQSFTNSQGLTSITIDADKLGGSTAKITVKTTNKGNIATINLQDCVYTKPAAKSTEHEVVDTVTLNDANDWTKLWTGLAQKDSSGNTYNYAVKELSSTVAAKSVTYSNNDGIQTGTIVVTNTLGDSYELPKTGGSGTSGITLLGVAVALASAGALLARRARKDKGTE